MFELLSTEDQGFLRRKQLLAKLKEESAITSAQARRIVDVEKARELMRERGGMRTEEVELLEEAEREWEKRLT